MRAPSLMAAACDRVLSSPEWAAATHDHDQRVWLLVQSLCAELHPEGPMSVPSVAALRQWIERDERDEQIRGAFDGRNYDTLARRHRLSTRQVRRIVHRPRHPPTA